MILIDEKAKCAGCHACVSVCPQDCIIMKADPEGFWYPSVDQGKCIQCGRCDSVCPVINQTEADNEPRAYACINTDEAVRMESSSGGIFSLIAERIIDRKGVVFGAGFDEDFSVSHKYAQTKEDLGQFRGSKYVQSRIGDTYRQAKDFLDTGREVLFSGTPCQIAGLKSYLGNSYDHLLCVDIICHGVPSPKVWKKYVEYRESSAGVKVQDISFRSKEKGWKKFSMSFLYRDHTQYHQTLDKDLFLQAFLKNVCLRPSCHSCAFKSLRRKSDITLGDFWGVQGIMPEMDDDKGVSLVFINSAHGQSMFDMIKENTLYRDTDINTAVSYNAAAIRSASRHTKRDVFFERLDDLPFDKLVKRYCMPGPYMRIRKKAVKIGVQIKRIIRRKYVQ